jgi:Skp family chaperone for outer membrane proteins
MKKLLPVMFLLLSLNVAAQHNKNRERIKALKVSFITEELDLSEKEAQQFWPVYNKFEKETGNIKFNELRAIRREIRTNLDTMSNEEATELIKKFNKIENNLHQLRADFFKKLLKIIPAKKIIQLKIAEDDFRKKMFEEFKKRRKGRS